jgi:peptidoglycan LD-endopeptidase CwlK
MPNPGQRDNDPTHLHPVFRSKAKAVLEQCASEQLPFQLFEGFRSPERQQYLYDQGRTRPGSIVTKARPWTSYHQYGVAADFVLFENGRWSWDSSGERDGWWRRLHEIARVQGLEPLSWETPHLQLSGTSIATLQAGGYPPDGDQMWAECLEGAVVSWTGTPASPPPPELAQGRPPLDPGQPTPAVPGELPPLPSESWHARWEGQEWRYDADGIFLRAHESGRQPFRTPGEPTTCRRIWELFASPILDAARRHGVHPALIVMVIGTETAFARKAGFTGPLTFRWEAHVQVSDVNPPRFGDYSAGPMQVLGTTARWVVRQQGLDYEPFSVAPALEFCLEDPGSLPLFDPAINIDLGTAVIRQRFAQTGDDPILVSAAYNAGGLYKTAKNPWCLRTAGDHLDRAAAWYGDACAVLREVLEP